MQVSFLCLSKLINKGEKVEIEKQYDFMLMKEVGSFGSGA